MDWVRLPHGTQFSRMILKPGETVRGSGDDLENYYYQLSHRPSCFPGNAFGRRISGNYARELGGDPNKSYRLAFRVLGMGDSNGVALAQNAHEDVLRAYGCLATESHMRFDSGTPPGDL